MKEKIVKGFIIGTFAILYLVTSLISTIHVIDFFELSNPRWMAISLAIAFELGAAASLSSIIALDKMNKGLIWTLFIVITAMQVQGNLYFAFTNLTDFSTWSELFNIIDEEIIYQKRIISIVSGAILPLVALGFIKSLVDYIKPEPPVDMEKFSTSDPEDYISDGEKNTNQDTPESIIIDGNGTDIQEENEEERDSKSPIEFNNTSASNKSSERKYPLNL